jgi:hypothetical protein
MEGRSRTRFCNKWLAKPWTGKTSIIEDSYMAPTRHRRGDPRSMVHTNGPAVYLHFAMTCSGHGNDKRSESGVQPD